MAKKMGELLVKHEGKEYRLCLTNRAIGVLQDEYGRDMAELMPADGSVPYFPAMVRAVELALMRYHPDEATPDLADDIIGVKRDLVIELLAVTFPEMLAGQGGKKPRAAKKKTT